MTFDAKRFMREKFIAREEAVSVPDLKDWFDGEANWIVRGITGEELAVVNDSVDQTKNIAAIASALMKSSKEKGAALEELLGVSGKTPAEITKRIALLIAGSVDPVCDRQLAIRMAENFPIEFYQITGVIMKLTGQGRIVGKPKPSGRSQASEQPQPSVDSGGDSSLK